jgi:hypothetical protein
MVGFWKKICAKVSIDVHWNNWRYCKIKELLWHFNKMYKISGSSLGVQMFRAPGNPFQERILNLRGLPWWLLSRRSKYRATQWHPHAIIMVCEHIRYCMLSFCTLLPSSFCSLDTRSVAPLSLSKIWEPLLQQTVEGKKLHQEAEPSYCECFQWWSLMDFDSKPPTCKASFCRRVRRDHEAVDNSEQVKCQLRRPK